MKSRKSLKRTLRPALILMLGIITLAVLPALTDGAALAKESKTLSIPIPSFNSGCHQKEACSKAARDAFVACMHETTADYWTARAKCYYNLSDKDACEECLAEAKDSFKEAKDECKDQLEARIDVCDAIGEAPYDPPIDPANFVDPEEIGKTVAPNPFFPLVQGYKWVYQTKEDEEVTETTTDEVLTETKEIMGVKCAIVHDVVTSEDGLEDTYDYYAQDVNGNVWYFGEVSVEYSYEDGIPVEDDIPVSASAEGSWMAGVDGGRPGILMKAQPVEGDVYRQEFLLGEAEDMGEVMDITALPDTEVPDFECNSECVKTRDFDPLEPDVNEYKYYKNGVGVVLEENPDTGERVELTSFSTGE